MYIIIFTKLIGTSGAHFYKSIWVHLVLTSKGTMLDSLSFVYDPFLLHPLCYSLSLNFASSCLFLLHELISIWAEPYASSVLCASLVLTAPGP